MIQSPTNKRDATPIHVLMRCVRYLLDRAAFASDHVLHVVVRKRKFHPSKDLLVERVPVVLLLRSVVLAAVVVQVNQSREEVLDDLDEEERG